MHYDSYWSSQIVTDDTLAMLPAWGCCRLHVSKRCIKFLSISSFPKAVAMSLGYNLKQKWSQIPAGNTGTNNVK